MGSRTISQMYKLQEYINSLELECDSLGKQVLGGSYEGDEV